MIFKGDQPILKYLQVALIVTTNEIKPLPEASYTEAVCAWCAFYWEGLCGGKKK